MATLKPVTKLFVWGSDDSYKGEVFSNGTYRDCFRLDKEWEDGVWSIQDGLICYLSRHDWAAFSSDVQAAYHQYLARLVVE